MLYTCKVMTIFIEKSVAPNFYDSSLFVCEKLILKTKFLPIKKEEISPKTSSSELDRYLIHRCHYYSYLKKSPLGKRLENCGELFLLTLLAMLKTSTRRWNLIHTHFKLQYFWKKLSIVFIRFFLNLLIWFFYKD